MWLKVGTRGDYRVIYVIIAFFVFWEYVVHIISYTI